MQHLPRWLVSIVFILGLWFIVQPVSLPTRAAGPWYVATTGSDTNSCLSTALPCATLNGVLTKAQAGDDIYVAGGTYVDTGDAVAVIAKGVQISGGWNPAFTAQITTTILDAQNQRRGVSVSAGSRVSLDHFTIQNGLSGVGGGVYNLGDLSLSNSLLNNNQCGAIYQSIGGTIYNAGTLTVSYSTLSNGTSCYNGGALYNDTSGSATLDHSALFNNNAWSGGSIDNRGQLALSDSSVTNNLASFGINYLIGQNGGGLYNLGRAIVTNTTFALNSGYNGGGIFNDGQLIVRGSTIISNSTSTYASGRSMGAGIHNAGGTLLLENSIVRENTGYAATGGGSSFPAGPYGGGILNSAVMTVNNSLISGNDVQNIRYDSDTPLGAGVFNSGGTLIFNNSTIANNTARISGNAGGLYNAAGTLILHNTIVVSNTADGTSPDCAGVISSGGYNLIGTTSNCAFNAGPGDLLNTSARFMLPVDPTDYRLRHDSPAINAGDPAGCVDTSGQPLPPIDLRGFPRPVGRCDIGATEMQALESSALLVSQAHATGLTPIAYKLLVRNVAAVDVPGVVLTDRVPSAVIYEPGSLTATLGLPVIAGDLITWTGTVPAGTTLTLVYSATVSSAVAHGSWITNTAYVHWAASMVAPSATFGVINDLYLPLLFSDFCDDFADDFSSPPSGWPVGEDAYVRAQYLNGEYRLLSKVGGYFYGFASPACAQEFYRVDVDARWASSTTSGDGYALLFDIAPDYSSYGVFYVSADYADFALYYRDAHGMHQIVPFTSSIAIGSGTASNHLAVIRSADAVTLSVNGVTLGTWQPYPAVSGRTFAGLAIQPYGNRPQADARFDNFAIKRQVTTGAAGQTVMKMLSAPVISISPAGPGFAADVWRERAWLIRLPIRHSGR